MLLNLKVYSHSTVAIDHYEDQILQRRTSLLLTQEVEEGTISQRFWESKTVSFFQSPSWKIIKNLARLFDISKTMKSWRTSLNHHSESFVHERRLNYEAYKLRHSPWAAIHFSIMQLRGTASTDLFWIFLLDISNKGSQSNTSAIETWLRGLIGQSRCWRW